MVVVTVLKIVGQFTRLWCMLYWVILVVCECSILCSIVYFAFQMYFFWHSNKLIAQNQHKFWKTYENIYPPNTFFQFSIIAQRCQIAAPRSPNAISSAADNAIIKNIECRFGCVARSPVLLKPNELSVTIHEISTSWKKTLDGAPYTNFFHSYNLIARNQ